MKLLNITIDKLYCMVYPDFITPKMELTPQAKRKSMLEGSNIKKRVQKNYCATEAFFKRAKIFFMSAKVRNFWLKSMSRSEPKDFETSSQ